MLGALVLACVCGLASIASGCEERTVIKPHLKKLRLHPDLAEDANLRVPSLVRKYGYPLEEHQVTTSDQYVLTMHRIPYGRYNNRKRNRPVVFVMHGLLSSSADFVVTGPGKALAYILAEEGFDVWLGNARGNRYSRQHAYLNPRNPNFWKFSWDEIGNIDLPAMIDYVLVKTNKRKLHYIGHSQGTTSFWVMCSLRPEYNHKIISMHALAPVAYLSHNKCPLLHVIAPFSNFIAKFLAMIGKAEFMPNKLLLKWAGAALCRDGAIFQELCSNIYFLIGGWNSVELNRTIIPVILGHFPAGASVYQIAHYGQVMASKEFRRFNYGLANIRIYKNMRPPRYDLHKITAPVFFHYSLSDPLAHVKDVERLGREIGNLKAMRVIPMSTFSHFDFLMGINAKRLVYDQVISDMRRMERK
ncbi:lipase 3-like [Cydia pomonella]|uniref:lipase 3-like n=1 Tax=Cydia pomonella TaxID=82600 RepID=UPI002ADDA393|nr:lipase 3-like [Cydia pomonella]